jgi:hypothetical protein
LTLFDTAKIVAKAANETAYTRLNAGKIVPGRKLAASRTNREWKEGVEEDAREKYGDKAFSKPKILSPAQMDGLPGGEKMTARWAFKPSGKLTVVAASDARVGVKGQDSSKLFSDKTKGKVT